MWDDVAAWLQSPGGARVLQTAIVPAIAILVAGLLAALIARSAVRATIRRAERVEAASAVAGLVAAARAAADREADGGSRRRAIRLRTEADVRTRLLPLHGADVAADWAAARTDAIQALTDDASVAVALGELRDRLIDWVGKPARARRIFAAPVAQAAARTASKATGSRPATETAPEPFSPPATAAAPSAVAPATEDAPDQERFARPGPRRTPPEAVPEAEPAMAGTEASVAGAAAVAPSQSAPPETGSIPAWQRTRAGERLQQERGRTRGVEAPTADVLDDDAAAVSTAPVTLARPHRSDAAPPQPPAQEPTADEAVRLEAHQQARHARPTDQERPATAATPVSTPAPAWLDQYDDEAQVTQNLDLKTPPPVAATAIRDRGTPGEDLVPRS